MEMLRERLQKVQVEAGVAPAAPDPDGASTPVSASACAGLGRRWVREAKAILATWTPTREDTGACVRHDGCQCRIFHRAPADTTWR